ncbi:two-component response regulator ARR12-like [Helianthus annuus]|uniref:two-component response regulator ARR12-like n=1 Tax=Helianthus annuus TaxID=4232 RepID=UPI000B8FEF9D|nr:two-component response regulator ARR12-like [Helianthus annuus]
MSVIQLVTSVDQAGAALTMLTTTKDKFDLLLIASDMSEVDAITFLRLTKNMDILSMGGADDNFLLKVLENGGFCVLNTPLTDEVIMDIRQDVIRARFHKFKMTDQSENQREQECESGQKRRPSGCAKKKRVRVEWTEEIHSRFIKAIHELGEKKCHPKNILELMGVPGLTRLQVASHLQKCRREVSKVLHGTPNSSSKKKLSSNVCQKDDLRMLGNNPSFATHVANEDQIGTINDGTFPFNEGTSYVNNQIIKDFPAMNGYGFENQGVVYSVPPDYNHNSFPPNQENQVMLTQGTSEFTQNI